MLTFGRISILILCLALGPMGCADQARRGPSSATPAPAPKPPHATVEADTQKLGVIGLGEDATAEFVIRNDGGAPLTLATGRLPRATRVEGLVPELSPGESVRIRFTIDTLEGDGNRRQVLVLVTNDPDQPRVSLTAELDVRPFLVARPGYARYITVQHEREGTITQTIGASDGLPFRVLRVESPMPSLRVSFREALPEERLPGIGNQWRVMSTLATDSPVGALTGQIVVHTDHPRQKRVFIPISGFVRPVLAVTPPDAKIGDLDRKSREPLKLFVKNFAEQEIELTGVTTDVAALKVEIEPIENGRSWNINLFVVPTAPLGPFEGKIVVKTASPKIPEMAIPVSGRLVEGSSRHRDVPDKSSISLRSSLSD